jgi:hypothetical protein
MSTRLILGVKAAGASRNLGALTSWNPVGLFRPVMGQLYFKRKI